MKGIIRNIVSWIILVSASAFNLQSLESSPRYCYRLSALQYDSSLICCLFMCPLSQSSREIIIFMSLSPLLFVAYESRLSFLTKFLNVPVTLTPPNSHWLLCRPHSLNVSEYTRLCWLLWLLWLLCRLLFGRWSELGDTGDALFGSELFRSVTDTVAPFLVLMAAIVLGDRERIVVIFYSYEASFDLIDLSCDCCCW